MGIDFIDQLMEHPNECQPEVDGDILNYLSIYAKLHPGADIYIAVPKGGSVASNRIFLWRWDRPTAVLRKVEDDTGGFPVRFAVHMGTGMIFSGVEKTDGDKTNPEVELTAEGEPNFDAAAAADALPELTPQPSAVPFLYELRGHYNRVMMGFSMQYAGDVSKKGFSEVYQTQSKSHKPDGPNHELVTIENQDFNLAASDEEKASGICANGEAVVDEFCPVNQDVPVSVLRDRKLQRLIGFSLGLMFGRDAAAGCGPYMQVRSGWYNTPHAADLTGHFGYSTLAPIVKDAKGRVRPLLNVDSFGGVMIPFRDSQHIQGSDLLGAPILTFGGTVSAGTTF
jgi:hypothetical protein